MPEPRLDKLAAIAKSEEIIPTRINFVDIAGLVRGASKGEGLGNQFLANIRECDAVAYVLRCFEDADITHVEGRVDPIADVEIVETELMLADLESLEKRVATLEKQAKGGDKESQGAARAHGQGAGAAERRQAGPRRQASRAEERARPGGMLQLLTAKPALYVCNVDEASAADGNAYVEARSRSAPSAEGAGCVVISAKIESEIALLAADERAEFLETLGLNEPGLNRLIREAYALLGLQTYFTAGPKEARAWTITARHQGAAGGRRHPHRLREGLHPRRDHRLRRLRAPGRRGRRQGRRQDARSKARSTSSRTAT